VTTKGEGRGTIPNIAWRKGQRGGYRQLTWNNVQRGGASHECGGEGGGARVDVGTKDSASVGRGSPNLTLLERRKE
jgi:hypothetical protein